MISTSSSPVTAYATGNSVFMPALKSAEKMVLGGEKLPWVRLSSLGGNVHHVVKSQLAWMTHRNPISLLFWEAYKLFLYKGQLYLNIFKAGQILASTQPRWLSCRAVTHKKQARGGRSQAHSEHLKL